MIRLHIGSKILLSILALVGYTFSDASPKAFINEIYAPYLKQDHSYVQTRSDLYEKFDSCLTSLLEADNKQLSGDVGYLDADPICNCQDFSRIKILNISQVGSTGSSLEFSVLFENFLKKEEVKITLKPRGKEWRIADISDAGMPSLKKMLLDHYGTSSHDGVKIRALCKR